MQDLLNSVILLVIMLVALGIMVSVPLRGKVDPWFFVRPLGRWAGSLPGRLCRSLSRLFYGWGKAFWRQTGRTDGLLILFCGLFGGACNLLGFLFSVPADILGAVSKK